MKTKLPLDVRIISSILIFFSAILLALGLFTLSGIAVGSREDIRKVLFGIVTVHTYITWGFYLSFKGLVGLVAGIGILQLKNWGKNLMIFFLVNATVDITFVFSEFLKSNIILIVVHCGLILWLLQRREIFIEKGKKIQGS